MVTKLSRLAPVIFPHITVLTANLHLVFTADGWRFVQFTIVVFDELGHSPQLFASMA